MFPLSRCAASVGGGSGSIRDIRHTGAPKVGSPRKRIFPRPVVRGSQIPRFSSPAPDRGGTLRLYSVGAGIRRGGEQHKAAGGARPRASTSDLRPHV